MPRPPDMSNLVVLLEKKKIQWLYTQPSEEHLAVIPFQHQESLKIISRMTLEKIKKSQQISGKFHCSLGPELKQRLVCSWHPPRALRYSWRHGGEQAPGRPTDGRGPLDLIEKELLYLFLIHRIEIIFNRHYVSFSGNIQIPDYFFDLWDFSKASPSGAQSRVAIPHGIFSSCAAQLSVGFVSATKREGSRSFPLYFISCFYSNLKIYPCWWPLLSSPPVLWRSFSFLRKKRVWLRVVFEPACMPMTKEKCSVRHAAGRKRTSPRGHQPHRMWEQEHSGFVRKAATWHPFDHNGVPHRGCLKLLWNTCIVSLSLSFLVSCPLFKGSYIYIFLILRIGCL